MKFVQIYLRVVVVTLRSSSLLNGLLISCVVGATVVLTGYHPIFMQHRREIIIISNKIINVHEHDNCMIYNETNELINASR